MIKEGDPSSGRRLKLFLMRSQRCKINPDQKDVSESEASDLISLESPDRPTSIAMNNEAQHQKLGFCSSP
jgi:hypothetical protein